MMFGVKQGKLYRLLGQLVCGSKGILDRGLISLIKSEQETQKIELIPRTESSNLEDGREVLKSGQLLESFS